MLYIYNGKKKFEVNKEGYKVRSGRLKEHILTTLNSSLNSKDNFQLRSHRAKTALKDLYDSLWSESYYDLLDYLRDNNDIPRGTTDYTAFVKSVFDPFLKSKNGEVPSFLKDKVLAYKNLKLSLEKILTVENKLINMEKSDILKFDKAVENLLASAKNPMGRNFFKVQYMKTMSECYGLKPKYSKPIKPKTDTLHV